MKVILSSPYPNRSSCVACILLMKTGDVRVDIPKSHDRLQIK